MTSKDLDAFDLTQEKGSVLADYGESGFARGLLLARRLVERGTKFVEVELDGWDTHSGNFPKVEALAGLVDGAVSTLLRISGASGRGIQHAPAAGRCPRCRNVGWTAEQRTMSGLDLQSYAGRKALEAKTWGNVFLVRWQSAHPAKEQAEFEV